MGGAEVKITVDTNVLVRAVVRDDPKQAQVAAQILEDAEVIAISHACLCELVWVLSRSYRFDRQSIVAALSALIAVHNVVVDRPAVEAGLSVFKEGGDFADGVIAHEGSWLGGETFVSFDKQAVQVIAAQGTKTRLLT